jgi:glycosyltransferase involved in cell wall biosynthesis
LVRVGIIISEELSPEKNKKTSWLGGLNYYKNVISAVYKLPNRQIEIVLFVNSDASEKFTQLFPDAEIIRTPIVDFLHDGAGTMKFKKPFKKAWLYLRSKLNGRNFLVEELFLKYKIDVSCYGDPLNSKLIKSVCWIADFQQMNHPEFFSQEENVKSRNDHVNLLIEKSDSLILSSETAFEDLKKYNSNFAYKARILKFVPAINLSLKLVPLAELRDKYQFTGDFFYLPNQLWKHKNHRVVIKAVSNIVNVKHKNVLILVSGSLTDYRNSLYINDLIAEVSSDDIINQFKLLGVIPYIDVLSLMHFSSALINPSFSEGWSSTVEEAKQLKVPLILSDIAIHREQTAETSNSILFNPNDHLELAEILINYKKKDNYRSNFDLHEAFEDKQVDFGNNYQDIILQVLKESN